MKLKHNDIVIEPERPFANCQLGREQYANILTSLVNSYADGFVLAINNEWGTGKTTFVKMWEQQLKNEGFKTLYFNAWENDFENGALTALMSELSSLQEKGTKALFKKVLQKGAILTKNALPILLKAIVGNYVGKVEFKELFEGMADNANELFQSQIQEYTSKKAGLKEFKASLEEFVKKSSSEKPIVFIIDELDRCRPNYAVDVLEKLKHFFNVPGIVFVLSIDKEQLGNAIRGVYGSESLNADEYLRRFIDIEYTLPEPNTELFCNYLYEYFEFGTFFNSNLRRQSGELREDPSSFIEISIRLFKNGKLTLRQQEKILAHARVVLNGFNPKSYLFPTLFVILIYFKSHHQGLYKNIQTRSLSIQELLNKIEAVLAFGISKKESRIFAFALGQLIYFYNNVDGYDRSGLFINDEQQKPQFILVSKLNVQNDNILAEIIQRYGQQMNLSDIRLTFLLNKIDLMDNFNTN